MRSHRVGPWPCAMSVVFTIATVAIATLIPGRALAEEASAPPPLFPTEVRAAFASLPKAAQPDELRAAHNGALYVLLPNGVEIIAKEKHNAPVISVQAWVRTGSIDEENALGAGLSHFCEHMLFKGTSTRPPGILDQEIRSAGGDDNAYTTSDHTVYHVEGAAEGFQTAFEALADMLMDSTFPPGDTQTEHDVVYKEIERALDTPENALADAWQRTLYRVHPYRVPVLGYPDRFKRVTRDEVFAYYKRRYGPQRTTFVAVGDFDAAKVLPLMAKTLSTWLRGNAEEPCIPVEPPQMAPREVTVTHPRCKLPKMMIGFPSVALTDPDLYALDVLASILGDGRSSRLYRDIKDQKDLVLNIDAYSYTPQYPGEFTVSCTAEAEKLPAARSAILGVLATARSTPPSPEELARAKRKVQAQKIFSEMTAEGVASALGSDWVTAGDLDFSETYVNGIQAVTAADVLRVARQYLNPQRVNVATLEPELEAAPVKTSSNQNEGPIDTQWLQAHPAGAKLEHVDRFAGLAVWELTLANGAHVTLRPDPSLPAVHITLALLGGQRWEPAELAGASNLLAELLDRGTTTRSKTELAAQVEDLGASLSTFSGRNSFGLQMRGLKADLPRLMELGADVLLHPAFAPEEFAVVQQEALAALQEREEDLFALNFRLLRPLVYGSHPYARELLGTAETVQKATPADLARIHAERLRPENLSISIVGDFAPGDALSLIHASFGQLKAAAPWTQPQPTLGSFAEGKQAEQSLPGLEGAVLTLAFPGVNIHDPDRDVLDVLCDILSGLGGRLNSAIREEKGMAYDVGVYSEEQLDGGAVIFYVQTDAGKLQSCREAMWQEIKRISETTLAKEELDGVKQHLLGMDASAMQDQSELAERLAFSRLYGQNAKEIFDRRTRILAVTPEQVQAAAKKYLDAKRWVSAVVKPAAK